MRICCFVKNNALQKNCKKKEIKWTSHTVVLKF